MANLLQNNKRCNHKYLSLLQFNNEARIALMINTNKYLIAALVLTVLLLILRKCNQIMKLNIKASGYFVAPGVFAILIVPGVTKML